MSRIRRLVLVAALVMAGALAAACGSDGDDLDEFEPGAQVPYTATSAA